MKKITYLLLLLAAPVFAQVGIGLNNPMQDLHLGGTTSTIRIEKLNSVNNPVLNPADGKLSPVYVDKDGELTLKPTGWDSGTGVPGSLAPLNFLINVPNFVPDGLNENGVVLNNDLTVTTATTPIIEVPFTCPQSALVEVKYGMTIVLSVHPLNTAPYPYGYPISDKSTRTFEVYFCIDINGDGLDATELSKQYGNKGQAYATLIQGIMGYPYMNSHGYANLPAGNHKLVFFGKSTDGTNKYTSIGFGGAQDYLKIRIFN